MRWQKNQMATLICSISFPRWKTGITPAQPGITPTQQPSTQKWEIRTREEELFDSKSEFTSIWKINVKNVKQTISHLSPYHLLSIVVGMGRVKVTSRDPVWGLGYFCCLDRVASEWKNNELLKIHGKKWKQTNISPPPQGNCFLLLFAWGGKRWCFQIQSRGWGINHGIVRA